MYASLASLKSDQPVFDSTSYADKTCIRKLASRARALDGILAKFYALPVSVSAEGLLTFAGNVSENDTVTIGAKTYTFKASPASANDVDIGTDAAATIINLKRAVNEGTNGGSYHTDTTINVDAEATSTVNTLTPIARVVGVDGDDLVLSKSATNITVTSGFSGGTRFFETLEELNIWMATIVLLGGQINSKIGGGGNVGLVKDIKTSITETIEGLAISGSLVDEDGTTRIPLSNAPVTNADTYPIADMGDPTTWGHDADRDFDRE